MKNIFPGLILLKLFNQVDNIEHILFLTLFNKFYTIYVLHQILANR